MKAKIRATREIVDWKQVRIQSAIAAMQAFCSNTDILKTVQDPTALAKMSVV